MKLKSVQFSDLEYILSVEWKTGLGWIFGNEFEHSSQANPDEDHTHKKVDTLYFTFHVARNSSV